MFLAARGRSSNCRRAPAPVGLRLCRAYRTSANHLRGPAASIARWRRCRCPLESGADGWRSSPGGPTVARARNWLEFRRLQQGRVAAIRQALKVQQTVGNRCASGRHLLDRSLGQRAGTSIKALDFPPAAQGVQALRRTQARRPAGRDRPRQPDGLRGRPASAVGGQPGTTKALDIETGRSPWAIRGRRGALVISYARCCGPGSPADHVRRPT